MRARIGTFILYISMPNLVLARDFKMTIGPRLNSLNIGHGDVVQPHISILWPDKTNDLTGVAPK